MTTTVAFLESLCEMKSFLKIYGEHGRNYSIITTNLEVQAELKRMGLPYRNTLEFFDPDGHEKVSIATMSVISAIRPCFHCLNHKDVTHAFERTAIYYLRWFLNYVFSQIWIVNNVISEIKPDRVIFFSVVDLRGSEFFLSDGLPSLGSIVNVINKKKYYSTKLVFHNKKNNWFKPRDKLKFRQYISFDLMLFLYKLRVRRKRVILIPADTYGISSIAKKFLSKRENFMPVYLFPGRGKLRKLIDVLCNRSFCFFSVSETLVQDEFARFDIIWQKTYKEIEDKFLLKPLGFEFCGADISLLAGEYIRQHIKAIMFRLNANVDALYRIFDVAPPYFVMSQHAVGVSYALGELCRATGVNGILISHGSHVPQDHRVAVREWVEHARTMLIGHYPYVAVQTPWTKRFLEREADLLSETLVTGPLIFGTQNQGNADRDELRLKHFGEYSDKKILLHAGTPKSWRNFRPWIYETPDEYVRNINILIEVVEKISGIHIAIRYRPTADLSTEDFRELLVVSECYQIIDASDFQDLLMASDILVSYSSTAIEEALQNRIPVLLFDPDGKYRHIPPIEFYENEKIRICPVNYCESHQILTEKMRIIKNLEVKIEDEEWVRHTMSSCDNWIEQFS